MVGSSVPAAAGACSGAGVGAGCPSPTPDGEGAGAAGVGAGLTGTEGDCGDGVGTVWAKAPAQSDEIKNEVDASNRGRKATESPLSGQKRTTITCAHSPRTETARYRRSGISPPPTCKGEIPRPAAGTHPRKQVSTCQGLVIPTSSGTRYLLGPSFRVMGQLEGFQISSSMRHTAIVRICGMQYIDTVLIPSSLDPAVWDTLARRTYAASGAQ